MVLMEALARPTLQRELLCFIYDNDQIVVFCTCSFLYTAHKQDALDIKLCYLAWSDYQLHAWLVHCAHKAMERAAYEYERRREYRMLADSDDDIDSDTDS